jgi:hypothetical protein
MSFLQHISVNHLKCLSRHFSGIRLSSFFWPGNVTESLLRDNLDLHDINGWSPMLYAAQGQDANNLENPVTILRISIL